MPPTELIFQPKHRLIWFRPCSHMTLTPDTWLLTAVTAVPCGESERFTAVCHLNFTIMVDLFSVPLKMMKYWTRVLDSFLYLWTEHEEILPSELLTETTETFWFNPQPTCEILTHRWQTETDKYFMSIQGVELAFSFSAFWRQTIFSF